MRRATWSAGAGALLALLGGCGGSSHRPASTTAATPAASSPAATGRLAPPPSVVVTLSRHVLTASDLHGFSQRGPLTEDANPRSWLHESEPTAAAAASARHLALLQRLGFVAGVREQLEAGGGGAEGISVAEDLGSPSAARAELQAQIAQLYGQGGLAFFAVAGIPGARGLATTPGGRFTGYNVAFAKGSYYYLVGIGFPAGTSPAPTRQQLITAAQRLYARVGR